MSGTFSPAMHNPSVESFYGLTDGKHSSNKEISNSAEEILAERHQIPLSNFFCRERTECPLLVMKVGRMELMRRGKGSIQAWSPPFDTSHWNMKAQTSMFQNMWLE